MRVICVKWGDKYGPEWVYHLHSMVSKHLTLPHQFVCMTDSPIPDIECIPCADGLPSWWSKVGLFRPGLFPGLNLYLDLDVVVTSSLDQMVLDNETVGQVVAPDDFSYSLRNPKHGLGADMRRLLGGLGTVNSSVMIWRDDAGQDVWDNFEPEKMHEVHGDQNWITQALWSQGKLALLDGDYVCSYKYHVQRGEPVRPIVVFHGEPKVTQLGHRHFLYKLWAA
jgi:hypothetical protein